MSAQPTTPRGTPAPRPRPPARRAPSPLAVITAALGLFFIVLTILAIQVRRGSDPSLGPAPPASSATAGGKGAQPRGAKVVTRSS